MIVLIVLIVVTDWRDGGGLSIGIMCRRRDRG